MRSRAVVTSLEAISSIPVKDDNAREFGGARTLLFLYLFFTKFRGAADEDVGTPGKLYLFFTFSIPKLNSNGFPCLLTPSSRGRAHAALRREWR